MSSLMPKKRNVFTVIVVMFGDGAFADAVGIQIHADVYVDYFAAAHDYYVDDDRRSNLTIFARNQTIPIESKPIIKIDR